MANVSLGIKVVVITIINKRNVKWHEAKYRILHGLVYLTWLETYIILEL